MDEAPLLAKLKILTSEEPSLGYRALHAKLKEDPDFQQVGLKKVQSALQRLRLEDALQATPEKHAAPDSLSPEQCNLFSASDDGTVKEWSHDGELLRTFLSTGGAQCVEVTPDYIIAGNSAGMLQMWSRSSGEIVREIRVAKKEHKYVKSLAVADGHIVTGDYCNMVQQWSIQSGQLELVCEGHTAGVVSVAVAGDYIISGGGNGLVLCFNRNTGSSETTVQPSATVYKANGFVCSLEMGDSEVLLPDRDNKKAVSIRLFDRDGGLLPEEERTVTSYKCGMCTWQASRAGLFIFVLCTDFTLKKFSAKSRELLASISVDPSEPDKAKNPYALKLCGDRCYISYINHSEICAFSLNDGKRQAKDGFVGHKGTVNAFCLSR